MYPGSNNYGNSNQQYVAGVPRISDLGFNTPLAGTCNQPYVAGAPYNTSGQSYQAPQGQFYAQKPVETNPAPGWNTNMFVCQNPPAYGGSFQQSGQTPNFKGYENSNQPIGQPPNPSFYCGTNQQGGQIENLQMYGNPTQPGFQEQNPATFGGGFQVVGPSPTVSFHTDINVTPGQIQNPSLYGGQIETGHQPQNPAVIPNPNLIVGQQPNPSHGSFGQNINQGNMGFGMGPAGEEHRGTMKPYNNFNAEQDCNIIRTAMKGIGTDEKAIIECLGRRNLNQRLEIRKTYKTMFGKDLIDSLKSELSGKFSDAVVESLYDSDYYDAHSLHKAMEGAGTREDVLTEILTSRSNQEIEHIKELYKKWFNKDLEKDVISETSGFYKRVLVSCLQANKKELTAEDYQNLRQRGPSAVVNVDLATQEAAQLYNAGEKKMGTDEAVFIKVFATRNKYQLRATFDAYEKLSGHNIIKAIESEMSGDLCSALKAIALQNMNEPLYFATRLHKAMAGLGTRDTALIRIILSRSEIDLESIKKEFQKQYNQTLEAFVKGDTSGDYMKYLLRFVEGN